jgi:hypothetical protein
MRSCASAPLLGTLAAAVLSLSCAASLPLVKVVVDLRGDEFSPLSAGSGVVLSGSRLTAWRPKLLRERRSVNERPGAIAIARDGRACATAAAPPELGLRSYRLPGLEPIRKLDGACNGSVAISPGGSLVACTERRSEADKLQTFVRVFTFPSLEPVQSWGPISESVDALSFVGTSEHGLAVVTTVLEPPRGPDNFRTHLHVYDARSGALLSEFSRPGRHPYVAFVPQVDVFVWAGQAGAETWSVRSFMKVRAFSATSHTIAIALSPNGRLLATSQRQRSAEDQHAGGGGNIQIFDTKSGELLSAFGSADLHVAANPHAPDQMLTDRAKLKVELLFTGAKGGNHSRVAIGDQFGGPGRVVNHHHLAFCDDETLASSGRGFLALWSLSP